MELFAAATIAVVICHAWRTRRALNTLREQVGRLDAREQTRSDSDTQLAKALDWVRVQAIAGANAAKQADHALTETRSLAKQVRSVGERQTQQAARFPGIDDRIAAMARRLEGFDTETAWHTAKLAEHDAKIVTLTKIAESTWDQQLSAELDRMLDRPGS